MTEPSRKPNRARPHKVAMYLNDAELAAVEAYEAEYHHRSRSAALRKLVWAGLQPPKVVYVPRQFKFWRELLGVRPR